MTASNVAHWDEVYADRPPDSFAWCEPVPSTLPIVLRVTEPSSSLIDIGGGTSALIAQLLRRGYEDLTVLDLSREALERHRRVLGADSERVAWLRQDVTTFVPDRTWHCWHDRATFHFLTEVEERRGYVTAAAHAVSVGGHIVVATFAENGPATCAGLPVCRYTVESLAAEFAPAFVLVDGASLPIAADGDQRPYVFAVLRR